MRETVLFLEICQTCVLEGKISVDDYYSMANIKFHFIEDMMEREKRFLFIDKDLHESIDRLYLRDYLIFSTDKEIVRK